MNNIDNPYQQEPEINSFGDLYSEYERQSQQMFRHPFRWAANSKGSTVVYMIFLQYFFSWLFVDEEAFPTWSYSFLVSVLDFDRYLLIVRVLHVLGVIDLYVAIFFTFVAVLAKGFGIGKIRGLESTPPVNETYHPEYDARQPESEVQSTMHPEELERDNGVRFCRHCGNPVASDMKYCTRCGKELGLIQGA